MGFLFRRGGNTTNRADMIGDFQINTASYGEVVPEILGTTRINGNIIQYEDFTAHEHKSTTRTGKGGGSKHTEISYTYTVACAIGLCEGPIKGIGKVWKDKEVYDYPNENIQLTLFSGSIGQSPWPYMQSKHPDKALPYSGLAYMAGVVDLGERGSLPNFNFEVKGKLLDTGDGVDVNPADYILHVLQSIGADVAIDGIDNFRRYCKAADILISTPPDQKSAKAQQVINDIAEITNCLVFWSTDRLKIVPLADKPIGDWSPTNQIQYNLTSDDFIEGSDGQLILYKRKDSSESFNEATVEFINRSNSYEKETVSFEVVADVQKNGLKPASKKRALYLYTKARAQYYAEQLAMKRLYAKTQYTFRLDWAFCGLEVGDIVTLTDEASMLDRQIVVITSVNEAADGQLEFTAEGKPPGTYAPAKYDVHENERPFVDYNAPAPAVNNVAIFQTVGDVGGNQIFVGVNAPDGWGGCSVWLSDNNQTYSRIGEISQQARMGTLRNALPINGNSVDVMLNKGHLKGGSHIDAERANTLSWVDGEALSYEGATLANGGYYSLTGLVRGQYSTPIVNHAQGARFIRVDEALFRYPYRKEDIGKKVYLKFTSMNIFGTNEQGLDEVQAYEYTIASYYIPDVSNLVLFTKYYEIDNGIYSFDVVAQFDTPQLNTLDTVELWYREQGGEWKYGGNGEGRIVVSGCELSHTYEVRLKVKDTHGNYSQGVTKSILIERKSDVPNTPQGFSVAFSDMADFNWLEVRNADIDFYEVRLDLNKGQTDGLVGKSNNTTLRAQLKSRSSKVYLFAHNPIKGYSAPAELTYNVPAPVKPQHVKAIGNISGIGVSFESIPAGCKGANVYLDAKVYFTLTNTVQIPTDAGVYNVKVAFVDMFGEGPKSNEQLITVKATIPKEMLDRETLGLNDIDRRIAALDKGTSGVLDYAKAVALMSRSPQLMEDPTFKTKAELVPYAKDGQRIIQKLAAPSPKWGDVNTGGQMCGILTGDTKYTSIGYGGFKITPGGKPLEGQLNNTYIVRMVAKVKSDISLYLNNNHLGRGDAPTGFLTSNKGSDKPQEYIFYWKYGNEWDPQNTDGHECGYVYFKSDNGKNNSQNFIAWIYKLEVYAVDGYDDSVANIKTSITQMQGAIDLKVNNLANQMGTRLTQLDNAIKLQTLSGDKVLAALTQYEGGHKIDGKLLHVTGQTLFDNNVIAKGMIQAGAVTADKLQVQSLSTISAYIGGALRGGTLIGTEIQNENGSFRVDSNGNIKGANITGSRIDANSVYAEGQQLKPVYVKRIDVSSGDKIELPPGYSWDKTLIFLRWISDPVENDRYEHSGGNMAQGEVDRIQNIVNNRLHMRFNMHSGWNMKGFGNDLNYDSRRRGSNEDVSTSNGGRFVEFYKGRPLYGVIQYSSISGERPPVFSINDRKERFNNQGWGFYGLGVTEQGYFYYGFLTAYNGGWGRAGLTIMSFW